MRRLLLCLPLCLILAPDTPPRPQPAFASSGLLALDSLPPGKADDPLPADNAAMEKLARTDPIAFLEACLRKYKQEAKGSYTLTMHKQERIAGKLQRTEIVEVAYRDKPLSIRMEWKKGARRAQRTLYVDGDNDNKLLVRPTGAIAGLVIVSRDPNGLDVKDSSRYPATEFGLELTLRKTLAPWKEAKKRGDLKVAFLGTKRVKEAGDRDCWVLERTGYTRMEEDGIQKATLYFDKETWMQVGSVLRGADDQLLGEYFFRDIKFDEDLDKDLFTRKSL